MSAATRFDFEGQCYSCGSYSSETNVHNQCRDCARAWGTALPESVQEWPPPLRLKVRPAQWYGSETEYRAFFEQVVAEQGENALALVYNDSPRTPSSHPTRWFCPGLPMLYTGKKDSLSGRSIYFYLLPAHAALEALDAGLVHCRDPLPT